MQKYSVKVKVLNVRLKDDGPSSLMVEYNCSFHILSLNVDGKSQKMQFGIKPKEPAFRMILVHLHTAFGMDGWYWMVISKWAEAFGAKRTINSYTTEFIYMLYQCSSPKFFRCWCSQQFHRCWLAKSFPFLSLTNLHQKSFHTLLYIKIYICPNICLG